MKKIAFIGLGVMGKPMALHLVEHGYQVNAYNRTLSKLDDIKDKVTVYDNITKCVADVDVVFTIVGFPQDVEEVYLSEQGIINSVKPGTIVVDMTTSSPSLAKKIYTIALEKGIESLDAPVSGGDKGAKEGTLSIMVGGKESVYQQVSPLLEAMGTTLTYMGPAGSGQHAKLANQICIAGTIAGVAESLAYAQKHGLDLTLLLRVLNNGAALSWQAQNNGPKMVINDKSAGFYIKHFIKDLKLALLEKENLELPILDTVLNEYESLNDYDDFGTQALTDYYIEK